MGRLNQSANMPNLPSMPPSLKRVSMDYIVQKSTVRKRSMHHHKK